MKGCAAAAVFFIMILISAASAKNGNMDLGIDKQNINLKELISKSNLVPYATGENENTLKKEINYNLNNIINSKFESGIHFDLDANKEIISLNNFNDIIMQIETENRNHDYNEIILDNLDIYQKQFEINTLFGEIIDESYLDNEMDVQIPQMVSFAVN
jgi:hypothetical protein